MTAAYSVSCVCLLYAIYLYPSTCWCFTFLYKKENSILSALKIKDISMSQLENACRNETPFFLEKQVDDFVGIVCDLAPKIWVVEMIKCLFTNIASFRTL